MDVYPSPVVARNKGGGSVSIPSRNGAMITAVKNHRHVVAVDDDDDDQIECTGKSCKSCTVGVVADCVALCCCPCAVISILGLAFFKIPWIMGKKILVKGKKKSSKKLEKKKKENKKEMEKSYSYRDCVTYELDSIDGISRRIKVFEDDDDEEEEAEKQRTKWGIVIGEEEELKDKFSGRFIDAEEVWFELYEFGHLGFGRVSFTGISPSSAATTTIQYNST